MRAVPRQPRDGSAATPRSTPLRILPAGSANDARRPDAGSSTHRELESARLRLLARQQTIVLQSIACLLDADRIDTALLALAGELQNRFRCTRVVVALEQAGRMRIRAVSQQARIDRRSSEIKRLERLLDEASRHETTIDWPADDEGEDRHRSFRELATAIGATQIVVIPLYHREARVGALVLSHAHPDCWCERTRSLLEQLSHPVAGAVALHRDANRRLIERVADSTGRTLGGLLRVHHPFRVAGVVTMIVGLAVGASLQGTHRIVAESDVRPVHHHVLAAPFDGFVADVRVMTGELLDEDAVLLRLDTQGLELERARTKRERDALETEMRAAMATHDRAEMARLGALRQKSEAELRRIQTLIDQATLRTPAPGRVLSADLSERVGSPVERGESLVSFAAHDRFDVRLLVDERDVAWIEPGQHGRLTLNAVPDRAHRFTVDAIRPIAIAADGQNRFAVEAHFEELPVSLLAGQTGVGRIDAGEARLGWIYTRRFTDWLRRVWWRWVG